MSVKEKNGQKRVQIFDKLKVSKACEIREGCLPSAKVVNLIQTNALLSIFFWKRGMSGQSLGGGCEKPIINT